MLESKKEEEEEQALFFSAPLDAGPMHATTHEVERNKSLGASNTILEARCGWKENSDIGWGPPEDWGAIGPPRDTQARRGIEYRGISPMRNRPPPGPP